jgi:hypothetical protein
MELQELEGLLQELLQAIQLVFNSGEVLSDEIQGQIAQTLELLYNRIEALRGEVNGPISPPEITAGMPSSNVEGFAYDDKTNRLYVRFLGKHPNRNGPIYSYEGVPPVMFDLFRRGAVPARTDGQNKWGKWWKGKVPSLGASVYTLLKLGRFPYQRLS